MSKPVVAIRLASLVPPLADKNSDKRVLRGYPINHPDQRLNDKLVRSGYVIEDKSSNARYLNRVETDNTIYDVMSWDTNGN